MASSPVRWRLWASIPLLLLVVGNVACGFGGVATARNNARNNAIRREVVAYELARRGPADELLVTFGVLEVRANLGFSSGNTVWLQPVAEDEYMRQRDPGLSFIFLHRPEVDGGMATLVVDRGTSAGVESFRLLLQADGTNWSVAADEPLDP